MGASNLVVNAQATISRGITVNTEFSPSPDSGALRKKYQEEREKRLNDARNIVPGLTGDLEHYLEDPYVEPSVRQPVNAESDIVVVGAGFGGLLCAARLREAGIQRVRIIDKAGDVGGVWYWNRYPGAMCDVESYVYMPLLEELAYMPTQKYAKAAEILAHAQSIARHYGLYQDALLQTTVTGVNWDGSRGRWLISTDRRDNISSRFIVLAEGAFSRLKLPAIPGIAKFRGRSFHTSRWDYDYTGGDSEGDLTKLREKVVGVIGTGASAIQCVPPLGRSAKRLYVFQRTPSTIAVRANRPTDPAWVQTLQPGWHKRRMENFTSVLTDGQERIDLVDDGWTDIYKHIFLDPSFEKMSSSEASRARELADIDKMESVRQRVEVVVKEKATAEALKPYYDYLCKRPCFHDEYLDAFNLPNVSLVDTDGQGVEAVYDDGVIVRGVKYPLDCLIFATGFEYGTDYTHRIGFDVIGCEGNSLSGKWEHGISTLQGLMTHGFPNMFILPGSNSQSVVTVNFMHLLNENATHVAYVVHETMARQAQFEVSEAAEKRWVADVVRHAKDNAKFLESCTPGRFNNEGHLSERLAQNSNYPLSPIQFFAMMSRWRDDGTLDGLELTPRP